MSADEHVSVWRRWRERLFATFAAWLVLQNVALLALVVWGHPARALAAGTAIASTAITVGGQLFMLALAVTLGLALAAWLVQAPTEHRWNGSKEARDGH